MNDIFSKIQQTIDNNPVVLFMKGTQDFPQCGFSAVVVQILKNHQVNFLDINVLSDPEIRQGIKDFSDWPTIPQLYIKGEFIGGCDIVKEMAQSGELKEFLKEQKIIG
ncbi:glutaredoxin [Alphaproteobacteria bacterium]|nr:glutaredoxin [Alphaproteobacteria bacterium]